MSSSNNDNNFFSTLFAIAILLTLGVGFCISMPSAAEYTRKTQRTLEMSGYQNIRLGRDRFTGCGRDDFSCVEFRATMNGNRVTGVVGCGVWKGCTVRLEP